MKPAIPHAEPWQRWWPKSYRRKAMIPVAKIRATQYWVSPKTVRKYQAKRRLPAVRLFYLEGGLWGVDNGHHRITAAIKNGRTKIWAELDEPEAPKD